MVFGATSGPAAGSPVSSARSSTSRTARARCRGCSSGWAGPRRSRSPAPSSVMRRRSRGGGPSPGPPCRRAPAVSAGTLCSGTNRGSTCSPGWSRPTYAPRARTPILDEWQTRDHLSVMGAVTPRGKVYSLVRPRSLNGLDTIEFLLHLGRLAARRLLVVWDGSPIHRRAEVTEFVADTAGAVCVERLPAYAPDLNPVEWLWRHLKEVELRNLSCLDLEQFHMALHLALGRVRQRPRLIRSFFAGAGLEI